MASETPITDTIGKDDNNNNNNNNNTGTDPKVPEPINTDKTEMEQKIDTNNGNNDDDDNSQILISVQPLISQTGEQYNGEISSFIGWPLNDV